MTSSPPGPLAASLLSVMVALTAQPALAQQQTLVLEGEAPSEPPEHFLLPFDVPEGTAEIEVRHDDLSADNILDWGLSDPRGFRGWGGGNAEPALVSERAASRSYLPGPIPAGTWHVVVGKAKIRETPARYRVEILLRQTATLAPQLERTPYVARAPIRTGSAWYAGDFHVHSRESGDAEPSLADVAAFARSRGLDFILLSEHNTLAQLDFFADVAARVPELLLIPGMEFTTYAGHANAIGATRWVDHKIGMPGVTIEGAVEALRAQGALVSINHPTFELGDLCIGCAWKHALPPTAVDAVEIASGGWDKAGQLFTESGIAYWDALCDSGAHAAAIGGSDDHRAGQNLNAVQSPIGDPTTLVFADELSVAGIVDGVRAGRTVVKLQGPADPMIELQPSVVPEAGVVRARRLTLQAVITGGAGAAVRFVTQGSAAPAVPVTSDPFVHQVALDAPVEGELRVRAEVLVNDKPRTVTSHVFLRAPAAGEGDDQDDGGCGCRTATGAAGGGRMPFRVALIALTLLAARWRRARSTRLPSRRRARNSSPAGSPRG